MTAGHQREYFVTAPLPCDVPGFAQAKAHGLTPRVPATPPRPGTRTTAAELRRLAVPGAVCVAAWLATLFLAGDDDSLDPAGIGWVVAVAALGVLVTGWAVRRVGATLIAELQAGYTTVTFESGRWWVSRLDRPMKHRGHTGWDWSGTWVLKADGRVVAAPRQGVEPPGLYPSPRRPGELELWTGFQWTAHCPKRGN